MPDNPESNEVKLSRNDVVKLLYPKLEGFRGRRFTQDTPILPEVWMFFADDPDTSREVLLTPHSSSSIQQLVRELRERLAAERKQDKDEIFIAYNESHALVSINFSELIRAVLPLSSWWKESLSGSFESDTLNRLASDQHLVEILMDPARQFRTKNGEESEIIHNDALDMIRVTGGILLQEPFPEPPQKHRDYFQRIVESVRDLIKNPWYPEPRKAEQQVPPLYSVCCNRIAEPAVSESRLAIKADAAIRLFEISCADIIWAVVDSGIDAKHEAFIEWPAVDPRVSGNSCGRQKSRVLKAYDFTLLAVLEEAAFCDRKKMSTEKQAKLARFTEDEIDALSSDLRPRLLHGRPLDWSHLEPFLEVKIEGENFDATNQHGTHVAGILAADWRRLPESAEPPFPGYKGPADQSIIGVCPDIRLYDLRVIDPNVTPTDTKAGGTEFAIIAALQFVRYLNMSKDKMVIHGVNLSFSLKHNVKSYACGSTPVCQECNRLTHSGVVVVAAAGNHGYSEDADTFENYRAITITDPGNTDSAITVGATHRMAPHRYGVSFFSSRGPTGDGRMKPDLVAPGEKITSVIPKSRSGVELDGTSMAAPHVSGAAALLMARHRELIGRPHKVKEVFCRTATDLGRERSFQGAGMLDVLRAIQSV
ncbi:MAG TPA: S8 family peptidase [Candidatus Angelobacter sp.]|jgi:hypothetical protein|nr:S8 family peptidase [Candidatus Angelobacter sp.]